jgi:hypothetical protein
MQDNVADFSSTAKTTFSVNPRIVDPHIWVRVFNIYGRQGKTKFIRKFHVLFSNWKQVFKQRLVKLEEKSLGRLSWKTVTRSEDSLETGRCHYEPVLWNYLKFRGKADFKFPGNSGFMYDWARVTGAEFGGAISSIEQFDWLKIVQGYLLRINFLSSEASAFVEFLYHKLHALLTF